MGTRTRNFANNILSGGTIDGTDFISGAIAAPNIANSSAVNVDSIPSISNVISPVAGDPPSPALGDIWYNSVAKKLRYEGFGADSFASGGNISTGRYAIGSAGTQTAGLIAGGDLFPASPRASNHTEEYNGSSWTAGGSLGTARNWLASCGTQTAAIGSSGNGFTPPGYLSVTENYDGSTWTSGTSVPTGYEGGNQFGTQTASIFIAGGDGLSPGFPGSTFEQSGGGAWTSIPSLGPTNYGAVTNGTVTAGIAIGGNSPNKDTVSLYDGSTWTTTTSVPYPIYNSAGNSVGTQTATVISGGQTPPAPTAPTNTLIFDGTSWTTSASLSTGRAGRPGSAGTSTDFYVVGGPPAITATEEFQAAAPLTKNFSND
jgi:hypothetical protein